MMEEINSIDWESSGGINTIYNLVKLINNGRLKIDNQKPFLWEQNKKENLIHSILSNYPIPFVLFKQNKDGTMYVIDGFQRLFTIRDYMNDLFPFKGMKFSELPGKYIARIEDYNLNYVVLKPSTNETELVERLNNEKS